MVESPFDDELRVGEVTAAESFPETDKEAMTRLRIDLGDAEIQSAAQLEYHYDPDELVGRRVLCATNLGSVRIAGFESEALTVGVPSDDGYPVLVSPDEGVDANVSLGELLYRASTPPNGPLDRLDCRVEPNGVFTTHGSSTIASCSANT